ncbi:hypothetical protein [Streptomyces sp. NPDC059881]|uniref:hypothetical protein n=1 Tax=Streptomyces sp. NPDC059881 TaxID=3346986 RepID=UPI00365A4209
MGLVLNATLGWSWADPVALVIAAVAGKEGRDAWQGNGCCAPAAHAHTPTPVGAVTAEADACDCKPGRTCCS